MQLVCLLLLCCISARFRVHIWNWYNIFYFALHFRPSPTNKWDPHRHREKTSSQDVMLDCLTGQIDEIRGYTIWQWPYNHLNMYIMTVLTVFLSTVTKVNFSNHWYICEPTCGWMVRGTVVSPAHQGSSSGARIYSWNYFRISGDVLIGVGCACVRS